MLGGREAARPLSLDMPRFVRPLFALCLLMAGCKATTGETPPIPTDRTGGAGGSRTGGSGGSATAGSGGSGGATGGSPSGGAGGGTAGSGATSGTGGAATGGSTGGSGGSGGGSGGSGGSSGGTGGVKQDAPVTTDAAPFRDSGGEAGTVESDHLPGRPDLKICKKEWTPEQCCAFLCSCLVNICSDSPKGKPGIATCMNWCPKLGDMARRCHVYHCYVSISPTGGIKDHDSHCGHAADQVAGGGCPMEVYK
jgi:hypothetical protein